MAPTDVEMVWSQSAKFKSCLYQYVPRDENQMADALATLASMWEGPQAQPIKPILLQSSKLPCYDATLVAAVTIEENDGIATSFSTCKRGHILKMQANPTEQLCID